MSSNLFSLLKKEQQAKKVAPADYTKQLKRIVVLLTTTAILFSTELQAQEGKVKFVNLKEVTIDDPFWSPKFKTWNEVTINDVLDKFEGKRPTGTGDFDTFRNFDLVAKGERGTNGHVGEPWFDGLVYETIRGIADYLVKYPNPALEARIDAYIDRIAAAQQSEDTGYLNTYTQLNEPGHRWGEYGGFLRYQHDVYNAGMMIEAAVHYYKATGKTRLLETAVRLTNHMTELMGKEPKKNIIPSHSGPEEAIIKLYWLFKHEPKLKKQLNIPVDEEAYWELATFWIENRGHHCEYPLWGTWGNTRSERWIKDCVYTDPKYGTHSRPSWGTYAQDSLPVFQQQDIEGHAVRATLLATGITAAALENHSPDYINTAKRLWKSMVGKRMFVTGGVGAIHEDEKFGPDYYLPPAAYLETCAAIGAGFFSQRMNELTGEGMYMDELERVLYNSLLTAVSLSGDNYTYQNPLNAEHHNRWAWHGCPCCPPMFLKITSALPGFIYAQDKEALYVNLFIGSKAEIAFGKGNKVAVSQQTAYPWEGKVAIEINPQKESKFAVKVRIPGWAQGVENPYGLYTSDLKQRGAQVKLSVNGTPISAEATDGYATISRTWKKGDRIELELPVQPRIITAHPAVEALKGQVAVAAGPVVYSFESVDNGDIRYLQLDTTGPLKAEQHKELLGGVNIVRTGSRQQVVAIPYYAIANRRRDTDHKVWVPLYKETRITINPQQAGGTVTPYLYGACIEDVNHEIYGGLYDQRIFGESFEEPMPSPTIEGFTAYEGEWKGNCNMLSVKATPGAKLVYDENSHVVAAETELKFSIGQSNNAGLLLNVSQPGNGADSFYGYEVSLAADGTKVVIGKHKNNFEQMATIPVAICPTEWNRLAATTIDGKLRVSLNGQDIYTTNLDPELTAGKMALRTWHSDVQFRNVSIITASHGNKQLAFSETPVEAVSRQWDAYRQGDVEATFALEDTQAFNGIQAQKVTLTDGKGQAGVANAGLNRWGIAVGKGKKMQGRIYLRGERLTGKVTIALQSADGTQTYASRQLTGIGRGWKKFDFELTPDADDAKARFTVFIDQPGSLWIDQVTLMSTGEAQFKGLPCRNDIGQAMVEQGLTFLRYGGTMINAPEYRFKKMIGNPDRRPPYIGHWNPYSTNGFGIEDFVKFCEAAGFTSAFAINIEETPEDVADMVEYLNGDITTEWGKKRAANGHPAPYGVEYIEIGNEEVLFNGDRADEYDHYIERFNLLYDAIRSKDPSVKVICAAWWRPESPNMERVFRAIDGKAYAWDYHPWADAANSGETVERELRQMKELFVKWNPDTRLKCAIFEENGNTHNMQRTLGHVTIQNAVRRMGDFVMTSCAANALQPYRQNDNGWDQGQVFFTPTQVWGMPPYYAQQMASRHHQPLLADCTVEGGTGQLDVTATRSEDGKQIVLHVANIGRTEAEAALDIHCSGKITEATATILSGAPDAVNTPESPRQIAPVEKSLQPAAKQTYVFAPHSYTILSFTLE